MANTSLVYHYGVLDNAAGEIRILKLLPGLFESPLEGKMETTCLAQEYNDLTSLMSWDALSYAWEEQTPSKPILLDGKLFNVTDNVEAALKHLRYSNVDRCIWVDSVCINQSDDNEKGNQVQQMHTIYRQANNVIVWLGLRNVDFDPIFIAVDWLHDFLTTKSLPAEITHELLVTYFKRQHPDIIWKNQFNSLLGKPWFNRLWVIQEATLAKHLEVRLGFQGMAWERFATTAACFIANPDVYTTLVASDDILFNRHGSKRHSSAYHGGLSHLRIISHLRLWMRQSKTQIAPSRLLHLCKQSQSSNLRDKVYTLQGLFSIKISQSHPCIPDLFPDYTITANEIFRNFTRWCCKREGNLDALALKRNIPEERNFQERASIPSWATLSTDTRDFRANMPRILPVESDPLMGFANYHELRWGELQGHQTLVLRGFVVDSVADHFPVGLIEAESLERMAQKWSDIITAANLPEEQRSTLFGAEALDIERLKRLLCASLLSEWRSSHLWGDGPRSPSEEVGEEVDVNPLLDEVKFAISSKRLAESDSVSKKLAGYIKRSTDMFRSAFITDRGLLAFNFRFVGRGDKICALYGGRGLFILRQNSLFINMTAEDRGALRGRPAYQLICGDCFIRGFEDGQGVKKAIALGLVEEDICIV